MVSMRRGLMLIIFGSVALLLNSCQSDLNNEKIDSSAAFSYLKNLEGSWIVDGGDEGTFGWEFDITARGNVIVEKLKVGTPAEMTTIYTIDNGNLKANHYCQLNNQPSLMQVNLDIEGDLHFECNGNVGNTQSHDELHMHGVHFMKKDDKVVIWMDMMEKDKVTFETKYTLEKR
jgi:hypothetical protein